MPFINLSLGAGKAHFCCYSKEKYNAINIREFEYIEDIYNHPNIVEARELMFEGKFNDVCRPECPHLIMRGVKNDLVDKHIKREFVNPLPFSREQRKNVKTIAEAIVAGKTNSEAYPLQVAVILEGLGCNIDCYYCSHVLNTRYYWKKEKEKIINMRTHTQRLISKMEEAFGHFHTVSFGGSEPLVYPEYDQICEFLLNYPKVRISVCTNGMLLNQKRIERVVKQNFTWLRLSVDAATEKTYYKIRRKADWNTLTSIISDIVHLRSKKRSFLSKLKGRAGFPKIQMNFVITTDNYREIEQFARLAHDLGVDAVHYKMLIRDEVPFVQRQDNAQIKEFADHLISIDPYSNKEICIEVLERMNKVDALVKEFNLFMPQDAVRPAIYAKYPDLAPRTT